MDVNAYLVNDGEPGVEETTKCQDKPNDSKKKTDFYSLYEELQIDCPTLSENKEFWVRKGNSQKYTCSLCNIGVTMPSNVITLKKSLLAHLEDKYHKKLYDAYMNKVQKEKISCDDNVSSVLKEKMSMVKLSEEKKSISDMQSKSEEDSSAKKFQSNSTLEHSTIKSSDDTIADFDTVYEYFEKSNPVTKKSKEFIQKHEDGINYFCLLCEVMVFASSNPFVFRYNLWVHLNEENHRKKLPNFSLIEEDFRVTMVNLFKSVPSMYKEDIKYFENGPVFRFVKCLLCEEAVSTNMHRMENHLRGKSHLENKISVKKNEVKCESAVDSTRRVFRKLFVQLDIPFRKDMTKYIQTGKMKGYIICVLCTYVILPTKFYLENHLQSQVHEENKKENTVYRESINRKSLAELMKTLPADLLSYNYFQESQGGVTCKICNETIPSTSYDLYSHIMKERERDMSG